MPELSYGHASSVRCEPEHLSLRLSRQLFGDSLWEILQAWFQTGVRATHWLSAPFRVMTAEAGMPGAPRWKQVGVDVLSWIVFHLLVLPDHPLVKLWQTVDWAAINRVCAPLYHNSQAGQRAWAPAQLFALLLLYLVLQAPSECELLRLVAIVPLYRWFCGLGLFTPLPDHSTLYTFRQRLGADRFEVILSLVVHQCLQAGLIANELAHFDMMGVAASARAWTPYERAVLLTEALLRYWQRVEQGDSPTAPLPEALRQLAAQVALEVLDNERLLKAPHTASRILQSVARWEQRRQAAPGQALWDLALDQAVQALLAEDAPLPPPPTPEADPCRLKTLAERLKGLLPHARGDLDARIGRTNSTTLMCGYWLGFLGDSLKGVITAVRVAPMNTPQFTQMIPALDTHAERIGAYPQAVAADSAQDYDPVHLALAARHIQGHIASRNHQGPGGGFGPEHFQVDEHGRLLCPAEVALIPGPPRSDGRMPYRAPAAQCAACVRKAACLPQGQQPDGPRLIALNPDAHQRWLQNRAHTTTEEYRAAQKQRFASEGWFGLAVRRYGADKMPYRSAAMNLIAGLLIGTAMNLALLTHQTSALAVWG